MSRAYAHLMLRILSPLIALGLLAAACGGSSGIDLSVGTTTSSTVAPSTTAPTTTVPTTTVSTTAAPPATTAAPDPTTTLRTDGPVDSGPGPLPNMLVANGTEIILVQTTLDHDVKTSPLLTAANPVTVLRQAADGTVFTQERSAIESEVARYSLNGTRTVVPDAAQLYDIAMINGVESLIIGVVPADDFGFGGVRAVSVVDPSLIVAEFGLEFEAEFFVTHADWGAGVLVVTAVADLTEFVGFRDTGGADASLPSPTESLAYNEPPFVTAASISADGSELLWAEGPDWGLDPDSGEPGLIAGEWILRGAGLDSGAETLFWPLSGVVADTAELSVDSVHDTGPRIVINRVTLVDGAWIALTPLILDFTVEEPELWELPVAGIAVPATIEG